MADARDDGLHLQRGEVLRFVNHHELVRDAPPTDVAERLHHDAARAHQVVAAAVLVAHVQIAQHLQRVMDGLHPGGEFFLE